MFERVLAPQAASSSTRDLSSMAEPLLAVTCSQSDCVFYHTFAGRPEKVYCRHADKPHYLNRIPCPLYRMDWQKKGGDMLTGANAQQFLKIIKKPGR